ncbi:hypothetical protein [Erythrobacter sp.]|uniref:hypothetical protein n=1 Tax=Erythrobacter sp. TaxID=1042 RepID=UPI002ED2778B
MRISSAVGFALAVSACGDPVSPAPEGEIVECAFAGSSELAPQCVFERTGAESFTIHHPDGSFRRMGFDAAGRMPMIVDGAEMVFSTERVSERSIEFEIGTARYRMPRDLLVAPDR